MSPRPPNHGPSRGLIDFMKLDPNDFVPKVQMPGKDLAKFVGGYGISAVVFEIELRGNKIVGKTSETEYELEAQSGTTFASSGGSVSFRTDNRGRVTGLVFQNGGAELAKLR